MPEVAPVSSSKPRVLIVEDEAQVCELLSEVLADEGFDPDCVQSDEGAYRLLRARRGHACMIVDVNLGSGTTGYDVARFARRLDPELAVIFVSGQSSEQSYRKHGVPGSLFVAKPFTADELMEPVRRLVGDNDA